MSPAGVTFVKRWEGLRLDPYVCSGGRLTIGYGHTGRFARARRTITELEADLILQEDLERFEAGVGELIHVPLQQHQFDALVSFTFNVGLGAFRASRLLRKLNAGQPCDGEFARWRWAGGRIDAGLVRRRDAERAMFLGEARRVA